MKVAPRTSPTIAIPLSLFGRLLWPLMLLGVTGCSADTSQKPSGPARDDGQGGTNTGNGTGSGAQGGSGATGGAAVGGGGAAGGSGTTGPGEAGGGGGAAGGGGSAGGGGGAGAGGTAGGGGAAGAGGTAGGGGNPSAAFSWTDGVIYYVFVDRFVDGNPQNNCLVPGVSPSDLGEPVSPAQYHGGDWAGVTAKINAGYFTQLGVNAIMLTSPMTNVMVPGQGIQGDTHFYSSYHGYWPVSVAAQTPSPCFGTADELRSLVAAAHANGIKVLFDHTIVHMDVRSDVYAQHANWFWTNAGGTPWCTCGTTACDWDPITGEGLRCWFADYLPHWNYTVPDARAYSVQMTLDWINQYGIDGLRLDAIKHVDESWLLATRAAITNQIVPTRPPGAPLYLVGETVDGNPANVARFVDPATRLDGQFDFPTRAQLVRTVLRRAGPMTDLATWMDLHENDYVPTAIMSPILGTHDMLRVIHHAENVPVGTSEWDDGKGTAVPRVAGWTTHPIQPSTPEAYERLANGFAVLLTNKGAPLIFYGDEIGLAGAGDPDNRRMMLWTGVTANQEALRARVTALIRVRAQHPATRYGTRRTIVANTDVWAYSRDYTSGSVTDRLYVIVNRGDTAQNVTLPEGSLTELLVGGAAAGPTVSVPARQTRIYQR
jgi:glycosidase